MYDYSLPGGLPNGSRTVWSQWPLRPLIAGPLTPFSYSVLAEMAGRAWYQYFDRLGFDPMPRARVLRLAQGRPYLNLTISAQRDAEVAALEPLTLNLDGQPFPICKWEKPGFLASLKANLAQGKIESQLKTLASELDKISQQAAAWYHKTLELRWVQAETLQIMEEIEQSGVPSWLVFFAARHNLDGAYNRLIRLSNPAAPYPANLALIQAATVEPAKLIEGQIRQRIAELGVQAGQQPAVLAWLAAGEYGNWEQTLPSAALITAIQNFLVDYGHRCGEDGEIAHRRWQQDPAPVLRAIHAAATGSTPLASVGDSQPLLAAVPNGQRKETQALVQKVRQLLPLHSQALHALAYILTGTRRWAMAAAKEAMADGRLRAAEEVFFFELEEMKQMMTGEWNISQRQEIQNTCARRQAEYAQWQQATPAELLIGESPAQATTAVAPLMLSLL